ncbi:cysteine--tRNA ligase [Patescibacteria group bacterium]|nr:cysteine--tRNA ligase [Patescibacteria group bacterium]
MSLHLYNTLSGKKKALVSQKGKTIKLFVCGPTVYDAAHIGHAKTYIAFDAFVKYLRERGFDVFYLQNITDIEDKIIERAKKEGVSPLMLARRFEKSYLKDMKELGVESVTRYARATEHIQEIICQVEKLISKGHAYEEKDGVYYDIRSFKDYGKLSGRTVARSEDAVSRVDESLHKRRNGDFALWKRSRKGEPKWKSPWGEGRPGWHVEDTAITEKYFGPQYDIHGGARDLLFPHHEAEIAQMEALSGKKPLARIWMHTGFLTSNGQKMAKSAGNFVSVQDFLAKRQARVLRFLLLKAHYRSSLDYSEGLAELAQRELERVDEFMDRLAGLQTNTKKSTGLVSSMKKRITQALENDFNIPKAIGELFEGIREGNSLMDEKRLGLKEGREFLEYLQWLDRIFGFLLRGKEQKKVPQRIQRLLELREKERSKKEWSKADEIRKKLLAEGWEIEDTPQGPKAKKA